MGNSKFLGNNVLTSFGLSDDESFRYVLNHHDYSEVSELCVEHVDPGIMRIPVEQVTSRRYVYKCEVLSWYSVVE